MVMMGRQPPAQARLFYTGFSLEQRVRADHPLRAIAARIDFEFAYQAVADRYGDNGNVSVPPPVILKLMLLLTLYNVRSERELMATVPERLDWLWFLGYDLDAEIPDHSVLSKARKRWGVELFKAFFERIVWACVQAGLVDGSKIFMDSSLIEANAANGSIMDRYSLKAQLSDRYPELERRLSEIGEAELAQRGVVNQRHISLTDPEATIVGRGRPQLCYQAHRAVDARAEVITATEVTRGDANEAHRLTALWQAHGENTERVADTVVADSKYGTIENFLACHDRGIAAHMPDLKQAATKRTQMRAIFPDSDFVYDPQSDTYRCPAGQTLKRKSLHAQRDSLDYAAPKKVCAACTLRAQCTRNKSGRSIKRHLRQAVLDAMREASRSPQSRRDIRTRQHLMERSFARGTRYGFDHARWRGRWRVLIQEYLTAAIQNIEVLIRHGGNPRRSVSTMLMEFGKISIAMTDALRQGPLLCRVFFARLHTGAINART
jgi:transposase